MNIQEAMAMIGLWLYGTGKVENLVTRKKIHVLFFKKEGFSKNLADNLLVS